MSNQYFSYEQVCAMVEKFAGLLASEQGKKFGFPINIYGVPRGGWMIVSHIKASRHGHAFGVVEDASDADIIVDDIVDSGKTQKHYKAAYPDKLFTPLIVKQDSSWVEFYWERKDGVQPGDSVETNVLRLLQYIGEDVKRPGLLETPARVAKAWKEKTDGYLRSPDHIVKVFEDGADGIDEMIVVTDIEIESSCEHHMERIWGVAHIAYIPRGKIIGLSKLYRIADIYARRLQVQERLTKQIADELEHLLGPLGVGVVLECRHSCMEARGICKRGQVTRTSALRGVFKEQASARSEFLQLAKTGRSF